MTAGRRLFAPWTPAFAARRRLRTQIAQVAVMKELLRSRNDAGVHRIGIEPPRFAVFHEKPHFAAGKRLSRLGIGMSLPSASP